MNEYFVDHRLRTSQFTLLGSESQESLFKRLDLRIGVGLQLRKFRLAVLEKSLHLIS